MLNSFHFYESGRIVTLDFVEANVIQVVLCDVTGDSCCLSYSFASKVLILFS